MSTGKDLTVLFAHRGNVDGPSPHENSIDHVDRAISLGYSVEVDLLRVGNDWYLGHDFPVARVSASWITARSGQLLLHAKTCEAAAALASTNLAWGWHYFCHSSDPYVLTSQGKLWVHNLSYVPQPSSPVIVPLITLELLKSYTHQVHGICSDYVSQYEN